MRLRNIVLTSFAVLSLGLSSTTFAQQWGDLTGQLIYDGTPPKASPINVTKDAAFCGKHNLLDESLVVNPENKGIANVLVYLYVTKTGDLKVHPDYEKTADAEVVLDNENCRYEPQVVLLRTTQTLVIGNKDPLGHNTKIDTLTNPGINPIIPAGGEYKKQFPEAERRPATVSCNIHPWMSATLLVQEHPYMAVTDKDGKFTIKNLPVGKWDIQFRHKKYITTVKVNGKSEKWSKGRPEVTIKSGTNDMGTIAVSPSVF